MMKTLLAAVVAVSVAAIAPAIAAGEAPHPPRQEWSFSGPFGTYDRAQLQRGFKVYREVCSVCHGLGTIRPPRTREGARA